MSQKIINRYEELIEEAKSIASLAHVKNHQYGSYITLGEDGDAQYLAWKVKVKNLLRLSCGEKSIHFQDLIESEKLQHMDNKVDVLKRLSPILIAAYDDFRNGFLVSFKQIVQAEVFDNELEQAKSLLESGYKNAAAVIAGVVLETAIKRAMHKKSNRFRKEKTYTLK